MSAKDVKDWIDREHFNGAPWSVKERSDCSLRIYVRMQPVDTPDELRSVLRICNEALRRLGEPCLTREMVVELRSFHSGLMSVREGSPGSNMARMFARLADVIESMLPPEAEDVQLTCPDCGQPLSVAGESVLCPHGVYVQNTAADRVREHLAAIANALGGEVYGAQRWTVVAEEGVEGGHVGAFEFVDSRIPAWLGESVLIGQTVHFDNVRMGVKESLTLPLSKVGGERFRPGDEIHISITRIPRNEQRGISSR